MCHLLAKPEAGYVQHFYGITRLRNFLFAGDDVIDQARVKQWQ